MLVILSCDLGDAEEVSEAASVDHDDTPPWEPLDPLASLIPGTLEERRNRFESSMFAYFFDPLMKQWSKSSEVNDVKMLQRMERMLTMEVPTDLDDELCAGLNDCVCCSRILQYVSNPLDISSTCVVVAVVVVVVVVVAAAVVVAAVVVMLCTM